jgi:hypothetical protein
MFLHIIMVKIAHNFIEVIIYNLDIGFNGTLLAQDTVEFGLDRRCLGFKFRVIEPMISRQISLITEFDFTRLKSCCLANVRS